MTIADCSNVEQIMVRGQLALLVESMIQRTKITVVGRRDGILDTQISVVDCISVESGNGHTFIVSFNNSCKLYIDLAKGDVVRPFASVIKSWVNIK
jgi:ethanolamine utilization protein EutP (predicted NTPase)